MLYDIETSLKSVVVYILASRVANLEFNFKAGQLGHRQCQGSYRSLVFLYTIELKRTEKCMVIAFGLFACNCNHCRDYPIVIRVNSVKKFCFFYHIQCCQNCFFRLLLSFISVNPKYKNLIQSFFNVIAV